MKVHIVQFSLHENLKYAKLTYNDRSQISGWFWGGEVENCTGELFVVMEIFCVLIGV
jgi:hypothetical protein